MPMFGFGFGLGRKVLAEGAPVVLGPWILAAGTWADTGSWLDSSTWID